MRSFGTLATATAVALCMATAASAQTKNGTVTVNISAFEEKDCNAAGNLGSDENGNIVRNIDVGSPGEFRASGSVQEGNFVSEFAASCNFNADVQVTALNGSLLNDDGGTLDSDDDGVTDGGFTYAVGYDFTLTRDGTDIIGPESGENLTAPGQSANVGDFTSKTFLYTIAGEGDPSVDYLGGSYFERITIRLGPPA